MARRSKSRPPPSRGRSRPFVLAAIALALTIAGWWIVNRSIGSASTGEPQSLAALKPPDVHALAVSRTDERTLIFGSHRGVLISRDGGASWLSVAGAQGDAMGLAVPPGSQTVFAAGHDVFLRSDDGGQNWKTLKPALPGTDIHGLASSASAPSITYAYVVGGGLFSTTDGTAWTKRGDAPGSTMSLALARAGAKDVLLATTMEGVQRSRDAGKAWESVPELGSAYVTATGDRAYAVAGGSVFASSDAGFTWTRRAFPHGTGVLIAMAPMHPELVYVVTDRSEIWRSVDSGATWERAG